MVISSTHNALLVSVVVTLLALLVVWLCQGPVHGHPAIAQHLQTMLIGGVAAAAAFLIARVFS